jgi:hypothetical protein
MLDNPYAVYTYGSRVYGTYGPDSDYDFILVSESAGNEEIIVGEKNFKCVSREHFQEMLNEHNISALECLFLPEELVIKHPKENWVFDLNLSLLRKSISSKYNHAWVKAKKKLISPYDWAEDEMRRGQKSLFHSFRILQFGIQIAKYGRIINYSETNNIFEEIMLGDDERTWDYYNKAFKKRHNELASEFRVLAPK